MPREGFLSEVFMAVSAAKKPIGRPTTRTIAVEKEILSRLEEGESLLSICKDAHLPNRSTWVDWIEKDPNLYQQYTRARCIQADRILDDIAEIEISTLKGEVDPIAARTVLNSKQWRAMKMAPKYYGDRTQTVVTGPNDGPVQVQYESSEEAKRALADLTARIAVLNGSD